MTSAEGGGSTGPDATAGHARVRRDRSAREAPHGERHGGDLPEGTATDVLPPEGTSTDAPAVQGIHRPDVGPGGADIDESDRVLPNRGRSARKPEQPSAPGEQPPLRRSR
ncbi:MAG TPA: hypothetical protein VFZ32_07420 [Micromonosporaceae bacterium]